MGYLESEEEEAEKNQHGAQRNKEDYNAIFFEGVKCANKYALRTFNELMGDDYVLHEM
jgi:hypothetical protein